MENIVATALHDGLFSPRELLVKEHADSASKNSAYMMSYIIDPRFDDPPRPIVQQFELQDVLLCANGACHTNSDDANLITKMKVYF